MKSKKVVLSLLVAIVLVAAIGLVACEGQVVQVTFNFGNDFEAKVVSVGMGEKVTAPQAPAYEGYTLTSWYTDSDCTEGNEWNFENGVVVPLQLFAKWEKAPVEKFTVTFVFGHDVANQTAEVEKGSKASAPKAPAVEGFTLTGWYTDSDCTKEWSFDTAITANTTIYAKWDAEQDPTQHESAITIAQALEIIAGLENSTSSEARYYIRGTVASKPGSKYGDFDLEDETGTIYVYKSAGADGQTAWSALTDDQKPDIGDTILVYGTLQNYKGTKAEIDSAWIIAIKRGEKEPLVLPEDGSKLTIAEAVEWAKKLDSGVVTTQRYEISGTVKEIVNPNYGQMVLVDEAGNTISVYGSYSADGETGYALLEDKPYAGDKVTVTALLQNFNGTPELKSVWIQSFEHVEVEINEEDYTEMTVLQARAAEKGALVKVSGVVAAITYANGKIPAGFILIDETSSIYVYDGQIAARVEAGNTVTILASKTYWILNTEESNAQKFGYKGCNQLEKVVLKENDGKKSDFNTAWMTSGTVKEIMSTPVTEDISTLVFKVNALIKKAPGDGFINYYIDDLDGVTGSYVYTQCNGSDFAWMDQFDGKICTVYLTALNAKSTSTGCNWRFLPVSVVDEGFVFDPENAAEFAVKYHGVDQFLGLYAADPEKELVTSVSSDLLNISGVVLSYASSDEEVAFVKDGVLHTNKSGNVTITITGTYAGHKSYSEEVTFVVVNADDYEALTVAEAIALPVNNEEKITVRGVVGPSLVNQPGGFYLIDETGVIAVKFNNADDIGLVNIGDEIIITGTRDAWKKEGKYPGQACISKCTLDVNMYGKHEYSTATFITGKTFDDLYALIQDVETDHTTEVWVITAKINCVGSSFSTNYSAVSPTDDTKYITFYAGSGGQYKWLDEYVGKTVTIEIALCNWNAKTPYKAAVLSVVNEDGTKTVNSLYFN